MLSFLTVAIISAGREARLPRLFIVIAWDQCRRTAFLSVCKHTDAKTDPQDRQSKPSNSCDLNPYSTIQLAPHVTSLFMWDPICENANLAG
jgi:hypothetical protein